MWDVIGTCSTWVDEPIKQVWVYGVVIYMIRTRISGCVVPLDLTHVTIEYSIEMGSVNEVSIEPRPDHEVGRDGCNCRLMKSRR